MLPKAAEYVSTLMEQMDSCGGLIECRVDHLPAGLGEPVFDKLDALLAQAIMSIGAVKVSKSAMAFRVPLLPEAQTMILLHATRTGYENFESFRWNFGWHE